MTGESQRQNQGTQPLKYHPVFNRSDLLTEGWYLVAKSSKLKSLQILDFKILNQRLVFFRDKDQIVHALDAFCPHMGALLANGKVVNNHIQCYFHRWEFDGKGKIAKIPCRNLEDKFSSSPKNSVTGPKNSEVVNSYPVREQFGFIWVYSASSVGHDIPLPAELGHRPKAFHIRHARLFAHHHILFANGLDLQHFSSVHNLDVKFSFKVDELDENVFEWSLEGRVPKQGFKSFLARLFFGDTFCYQVKIAGGSIASISYGVRPLLSKDPTKKLWRRPIISLPSLHVFWACRPTVEGSSEVDVFILTKSYRGAKKIISYCYALITLLLLNWLRDEDIKAFPSMRFNDGIMLPEDQCVAKLIAVLNQLPISIWSRFSTNQRLKTSATLSNDSLMSKEN